MTSIDDSTKEEPINDTPSSSSEDVDSIFSKEEIRDIVKGFLQSWLRGDITINFPSANELYEKAKFTGHKIDLDTALNQEIEGKDPILDLMSVCAGNEKATSKERERAIADLFKTILILRSSDRLKGRFMVDDLEKRLSRLEQDLNETNKLLNEISMTVHGLLSRDRSS